MRLRTVSGSSSTFTPLIRACPASGVRRVARIRTRVVFPAALCRSRPCLLPAGTLRSTPTSALVSPNALLTPCTSIMATLLSEMAVAVISNPSETTPLCGRAPLRAPGKVPGETLGLLAGSDVHPGRVESGVGARDHRRNPVTDHLLTPQNAALVLIDFQPSQLRPVTSIAHHLLVDNIVSVARLAKTFELPIVLSTINVADGMNPTLAELKRVLPTIVEIDRSESNAWENGEFRHAVERTGRRKLVVAALWTDVSLAFPALDAMRHGYEIYPVVDAVGATSLEAHRAGLERIGRAGGQPISWGSLAWELQRD